MLPVRLCLAALCVVTAPVLAQRARNADEAIVNFEEVRSAAERNRHRAVRDLGRFPEDEVTEVLLAELKRAKGVGYRSTVVDALGRSKRNGAVPALTAAMTSASNARLMETAANGLRTQGEDGVAAMLAALPTSTENKRLRDAICYSLSRLQHGDAARDRLLTELQRASRQDRQSAMRGLQARRDDPKVDAVRVKLVTDKDSYLGSLALMQLAMSDHEQAPALALAYARSLGKKEGGNRQSAVVAGLLAGLEPKHYQPLFFAAARADKPFDEQLQPRWRASFAAGGLAAWIRDKAPKFKEDRMQVAAARALQFVSDEQKKIALTALRIFLQKRSTTVVQAAAGALTGIDAKKEAIALLQDLVKAQKKATSPIAITAITELQAGEAAWQKQLLQLSAHKLGPIRAAALRALHACAVGEKLHDPDAAFDAGDAALAHKEWQVRAAGLDLLQRLRSPATPPLLFPLLKTEKARMLADVRSVLRDLTGLQFATVAEWQSWWQKEGESFQPRAPTAEKSRGKNKATVSYWNIPVHSDRVAFVVDMSGSMLKPFGTANATRLYEAKRQLRTVLAALPAKAKTDIITFAGAPEPLFGKLQALGKKQQKQAEAFLQGLVAKGATNVHDALAAAFANRDVDTIYLLTDGRPSSGPIVAHDTLAQEVARWNAGRGIRIHTIAIGQKSDLLERLAADSGGQHIVSR